MKIRLAIPEEAQTCWNIRNLSIRQGCKTSYSATVLDAWTPEAMPESYREVITDNPFFVVEMPEAGPVATGYLDLLSGSVEAIFTLPEYFGKGLASLIIATIKGEARKRGWQQLTLSSTPNAQTFYEKHGFVFIRESTCPSGLARTDLRCMEMYIEL
ncbi:GNAT family N-acetyltransferase [Erwinia psidii]|uniref:GNAT family N-acetyltransferase n=1 Tax=Erwinia psidii TaxID=69224 RepID=A0A3N6UL24_9GAMM|nr:GNAT family N-acetyltransferase [Erwinia psidii]MCX8958740.1 GNAT family N-acetyltransferase [Erwinia psidii]MCX8963020.1 GNAT family N-acetyltransferase [Erwinia psidii]MCX8967364.1 GNAT family N-acetyltransferase [Erwinia psidii]RQM36639.1 GNAT family N-acetyltransferase [Erwinia psidii]